MSEPKPSNVAYHEAGHAAAQIACGNVFRCVSILGDGDGKIIGAPPERLTNVQ